MEVPTSKRKPNTKTTLLFQSSRRCSWKDGIVRNEVVSSLVTSLRRTTVPTDKINMSVSDPFSGILPVHLLESGFMINNVLVTFKW